MMSEYVSYSYTLIKDLEVSLLDTLQVVKNKALSTVFMSTREVEVHLHSAAWKDTCDIADGTEHYTL